MRSKSQLFELIESSDSNFNSEPLIKKTYFQNYQKSDSSESQSQSELQSSAESIGEYKPNGFHPVFLGEKFGNQRYQVISKLGWGTFSTVWLVWNNQNNQYYAMKIQKSKKIIQEAALDELKLLKYLNKNKMNEKWMDTVKQLDKQQNFDNYCVRILDDFPHFGIHGTHFCSVFDILGPTLLNVIQSYQQEDLLIKVNIVKQITRQILMGLVFIHEICGIIHTDIKPENIMFKLNKNDQKKVVNYFTSINKAPLSQKYLQAKYKNDKNQKYQQNFFRIVEQQQRILDIPQAVNSQNLREGNYLWKKCVSIDLNSEFQIVLVDFGNACWINKHFSEKIQTKEYRSPESIIGAEYNEKCDIWSLGCMIFEMLTNNYLFNPQNNEELSEDEDHLAMIIETIGPFKKEFLEGGKLSKRYFDKNCQLKRMKNQPLIQNPISEILVEEYGYDPNQALDIQKFLLSLLQINPQDRLSARDALTHSWLQN